MSDSVVVGGGGAGRLTATDLRALREDLVRIAVPTDDAAALALVEELERTKAACAAAQASTTTVFAARRRTALETARDRARAAGRHGFGHIEASIGAEVALARRESPGQGRSHLELATALTHDLPQTLVALYLGDLSEDRAMTIARETADLTAEDRRAVDAELFDPRHYDDTTTLGDLQLRDLLRRIAYRLDPDGTATRWDRARTRRRVTTRNLGDGTARISAIVAIEHAATITTTLDTAADTARAAGDPRTRDQVKADTVVARITGQSSPTSATPEAGSGSPGAGSGSPEVAPNPDTDTVPVKVNLVISAESLLGDGTEPGHVPGIGAIPVAFARHWVARATAQARAELRRLFTTPTDRELVAMESRSRYFPPGLAELIALRDGGTCRTAWCNAPIRHTDHAVPIAHGGTTTLDDGQGLCEVCNYIKETPDWITWVTTTNGRHEVSTLTPSDHTYTTRPPPQPGPPRTSPTGLTGEFYVPETFTLHLAPDYRRSA